MQDDSAKSSLSAFPKQSFSGANRLQKGYEFLEVKKRGDQFRFGSFFMQVFQTDAENSSKLGVIASKRLGNAVKRNKAKRIFREIFRKNLSSFQRNISVVVVPRKTLFNTPYSKVQEDFLVALKKV